MEVDFNVVFINFKGIGWLGQPEYDKTIEMSFSK